MSKRLLFFTVVSLAARLNTLGQVFPYDFSVYNDPYYDLTAPISISNNDVWDDPDYLVSSGINVQIFDDVVTTLGIFQPGAQVISFAEANPQFVQVACPYMADIMNANDSVAISPISYQLEGPPGNAILKLEWKNVGFYGEWDAANTFFNTTNFQVWFYENAPIIEYRYGPNTIKSGGILHFVGTGPLVLLAKNALFNETGWEGLWCVSGNPDAPTITTVPSGQQPFQGQELSSEPASGTVYRFAFIDSHVSTLTQNSFKLWPTACRETVYLQSKQGEVIDVYDATGRLVTSYTSQGTAGESIAVAHWAAGSYIAKNRSGEVIRFIKH
jgi:hypothetical protein